MHMDSVRSLDVDPPDGFTDAPPFMASDEVTLAIEPTSTVSLPR